MIKVSRGCLGEEELAKVREAFEYGYFGLVYKALEFEKRVRLNFMKLVDNRQREK